MSERPKKDTSIANVLMEGICERLPNCTRAMEIVETGIERELTTRERIALRYHGRLCPFCGCATGRFESALHRMKEAEAERSAGSSANQVRNDP